MNHKDGSGLGHGEPAATQPDATEPDEQTAQRATSPDETSAPRCPAAPPHWFAPALAILGLAMEAGHVNALMRALYRLTHSPQDWRLPLEAATEVQRALHRLREATRHQLVRIELSSEDTTDD